MSNIADEITIVSGLPRSGTSMMMRMIDAGGLMALTDNIRVADSDNPRGYFEFEPVKRTKEDSTWLSGARGRAVKMVYRLLYDLPAEFRYRVIFMRRKLLEVVRSQDAMLTRLGKSGGELSPDKIIGLFEQQIHEFESWVAGQSNFQVLYISYNDVLEAPRPIVAQVNAFLGGGLDEQRMLAVVEPDLYRQRS